MCLESHLCAVLASRRRTRLTTFAVSSCRLERDDMEELKSDLKTDSVIIGTKRTLKALRQAQLKKIYLASNCPVPIREDVEHFASFENVPVETLDIACDELGAFCKKPFMVSVLGVQKKK